MPFYSSSEAKNAYFMTSEATNEINFLASRGAINGIFIPKGVRALTGYFGLPMRSKNKSGSSQVSSY